MSPFRPPRKRGAGRERCDDACYFGGPANSVSPVALRPSLTRGLPFQLPPKADTDLLRSTSQGLCQVTPNSNQSATVSQPGERILRLPEPSRSHTGDAATVIVGRRPEVRGIPDEFGEAAAPGLGTIARRRLEGAGSTATRAPTLPPPRNRPRCRQMRINTFCGGGQGVGTEGLEPSLEAV